MSDLPMTAIWKEEAVANNNSVIAWTTTNQTGAAAHAGLLAQARTR